MAITSPSQRLSPNELTNWLTNHKKRLFSSVPIIDHPIDRSLDCDLLFFTSPSDFCSHYSRSFLLDRWWWPSSFVVSSIQFNPRYALAVILYQETDPWWTWLMYCNKIFDKIIFIFIIFQAFAPLSSTIVIIMAIT